MTKQTELLFAEYIRYSTKKQTDGLSTKMQSLHNGNLIEKFNGKFTESFLDKETSGYHTVVKQRPEMNRLIEAIKSGTINCIVFYDESRLSRRIIDFYVEFLEPILKVNPKIRFFKSSTNEEWFPNSEQAKHNLINAYNELNKKALVARRTQEVALNEGKRPGGKMPFGISEISENIIIPNDDIILVLFIFQLASWGYSERKIGDYLNELVPNSSTENTFSIRNWDHSSIHYILNNPIYIGLGTWDRRTSKNNSSPKPQDQITLFNEYPPVIPAKLWDLAHFELDRKRNKRGDSVASPVRMDKSFLLTNIVKCSECDIFLNARNSLKKGKYAKKKTKDGKPLKYYYCSNCGIRIDADELDVAIFNKVKLEIINYFSQDDVLIKINYWIKFMKNKLVNTNELIEWHTFQSIKIDKLKNLLPKEHIQKLVNISKSELLNIKDLAEEYKYTLSQLTSLKDANTFKLITDRFLNINEQPLFSSIEERYILFSTIESLHVKAKSSNGDVKLSIEYKDIPIPVIQNQLKYS